MNSQPLKLFRVDTGLGSDYAVAEDEGKAAAIVKKYYDDKDYGFSHERVATKVCYIASTEHYPSGNGACDSIIGRLMLPPEKDTYDNDGK